MYDDIFKIIKYLDFNHLYKIEKPYNRKVLELLTREFQTNKDEISEYKKDIKKWALNFKKNCPKNSRDSFFYISRNATSFHYANLIPIALLDYGWSLFFKKFPNGKILIIKFSEDFYDTIMTDLDKISISKHKRNTNNPFLEYPQEYTGVLSFNFPYIALNFLSYGIPSIILGNYEHLFNVLLYYIPDVPINYSQLTESSYIYNMVLRSLINIFSDNLSQNMPFPSGMFIEGLNLEPINQLGFFEYFIKKINNRMINILEIQNPLKREQLVMTINRAICDAQLCVTSDIPYISKTFFFNCIDKISNFMTIIDDKTNDTIAFKKLFDLVYLKNVILKNMEHIPNNIGVFLQNIIKEIILIIKRDGLTPEYMRAMRNSHHGYNLYPNNVKELINKSGELDNFLVYLVIPLIHYFLSIKWKTK